MEDDECPIHSKSHKAHDERIYELEHIVENTGDRTAKILAKRLNEVEVHYAKLMAWAQEAKKRLNIKRGL